MLRRIFLISLFAAFVVVGYGLDSAFAEHHPCGKHPCAANPCAANPCGANPCAANPCAANPCAAQPCAAQPCAAQPCAAQPCAPKVKQIRKWPMKNMAKVQKDGERLWNDPSLGNAGVSCGTCHPGGAGLKAEPFPKYIKMADDILTLDQMINFCMENPMKSKRLSWNHQNLTALAAYVKAHAGANPCGMQPCAANPCGANPCAANPCAANPCGANPCGK